MTPIYLDNNSTTALHPDVAGAMQECFLAAPGNPASQHSFGRNARRIIESARERIGALLGAKTSGMHADHVIFTSGGTEANNLAIAGLSGTAPGHIVISAIEHPSVVGAAQQLAAIGFEVQHLPVDSKGVVQTSRLPELIRPATRLVSTMLANNETGVLQPIAELSALCRDRSVLFHTDAVQAVGKAAVDFSSLDVAAMSFSAHKFHGPVGIGGLVVRHGVTISPQLHGGFQQAGLRPGTEPVALVVGLLRALEIATQSLNENWARMNRLRDLLAELLCSGFPATVINGHGADRLPQTLNVGFPGINRQALVMALDMAGVACSTGSACASGSSEPSPVLQAMKLSEDVIEGSIRFSLSPLTTETDVNEAVRRILSVLNDLRRPSRTRSAAVPPPLAVTKRL